MLGIAAVVFFASLSTLGVIGTEFVPAEDRGQFEVNAELPPGTSFEQSVEMVAALEKKAAGDPRGPAGVLDRRRQRRSAQGQPARQDDAEARARARARSTIKTDARQRIATVPLVKAVVTDPEFMQGAPTQAPISVYVRGDDMDALQRLSDEIVAKIRQVPGTVDVDSTLEERPARDGGARQSRDGRRPRLRRRQRRHAAARHGRGRRADQAARRRQGIRHPRAARAGIPQRLPGDRPRAALLAARRADPHVGHRDAWSPGIGPTNIEREQRRRQAKIGVELSDRPLGDVTTDVAAVMATVQMPANFEWGFLGDVELMQESAAAMGLAMLLAVAFIYIVLASQFESFLEPFLIMLSLPLAVVGALLAILLTGNNLGMPAMIGMVMLMGLVTKNAILLIDMTNHYVREGMPVEEAILTAGPIRLRPILMTTMAMILGMLPSALGRGEGGEFRAPISIATIGGLITSTALTLVVVPVAYLLLARFLERVKTLARQSRHAQLHPAVRVTGVLLLVVLVGWFLSATASVCADIAVRGQPQAGRRLAQVSVGTAARTDLRQALARALSANESLKVVQEQVRESQGRVEEAKAELPAVGQPELPLHAGAALSADPDSGRHLRPRRADVRGRLHAPQHHAGRDQPADLHGRPADRTRTASRRRRSTRRSCSSSARGRSCSIRSSRRSMPR